MEKEVMQEIIAAIKEGTDVICESEEERNELIKFCSENGIPVSSFVAALGNNDKKALKTWLKDPDDTGMYLLLSSYHGCVIVGSNYMGINYDNVLFTSSFESPSEAVSNFDKAFNNLIGG